VSTVAWALIVCTLLSLGLTPAVRAFCLRAGVVDRPGPRSMHTAPIATLGGLGMFAAFAAGVWLFAANGLGGDTAGLIAGGAATLAVGAVDDLAKAGVIRRLGRFGDAEGRGLRPVVKMIGQLAAAAIAVAGGVQIAFIHNPLSAGYIYLYGWAVPVTIGWMFCVGTVINLIDGLDGLAAGVVAIVAAVLLITSLEVPGPLAALPALLSVIVLGSALGFLPWNWAPARIIMGDSGALFLGYALAAVSVEGTLKSSAALALSVPVIALGLPVFDAAFAVFRRWRGSGRGLIAVADRDHLHHRLMALGFSTRDTVILIYIITGWLGIGAIALGRMGWLPGALLIAFIVVSLGYLGRRSGLLTPGAVEVAASKPGGGAKH
jgi:UDP-GlcNAc:undecaprenyl-phosphate GlcNAc-1-phosphate transferase